VRYCTSTELAWAGRSAVTATGGGLLPADAHTQLLGTAPHERGAQQMLLILIRGLIVWPARPANQHGIGPIRRHVTQ